MGYLVIGCELRGEAVLGGGVMVPRLCWEGGGPGG